MVQLVECESRIRDFVNAPQGLKEPISLSFIYSRTSFVKVRCPWSCTPRLFDSEFADELSNRAIDLMHKAKVGV